MQKQVGLIKYCFLIIMLFSSIVAGTAQELCEELSREIFEETDDNCAESDNESACYGFDTISATFFEDVGDNFSDPGELVEMLQLHTLRSSPFDEEEEEWGIGYFRISIEGSEDPLIIMAAGDVIVENDVQAAQDAGVSAMQAFNFTTGGASTCNEAPNAVFIQSPDNVEVDLVINSTPLRIGSTVVLGTVNQNIGNNQPQNDTMWIAVVEGEAVLNPDSEEEVTVPQGSASTVPLSDEEGNNPDGENQLNTVRVPVLDPLTGEPILGPDGEPFYRQIPIEEFSDPQEITENGEGVFGWNNYGFIENMPPALLNYEVDVPDANDDEDLPPVVSNPPPPVGDTSTSSASDSAVTECGTLNWCNAGEPWGDGRCNDPETSDWFWSSGWYQAQLECGAIETIPATFQGADQATAEELATSASFTATVLGCTPGSSALFSIKVENVPLNATYLFLQHQYGYGADPVTPPGPSDHIFWVNSANLPLTNIMEARSGPSISDPIIAIINLAGPLTC